MVSVYRFQEKCPLENCPLENCSSQNCPPGKLSPKNCPPPPENFPNEIFFCEILSVRKIYFYSINFFITNLFFVCFRIIFSYAYILDFQARHIIFIIHVGVTNNAGHRYLATRFFFISNTFYNSASVLLNILINRASNVA